MSNGNGRDRRIDTDGEWAREVERRQRANDRPQTLRLANWVLSVQDGEIVATTPGRPPVPITAALATAETPTGTGRVMRVVQILGGPTSGTWGLIYRGAPTVTTLSRTAASTDLLNALLALDVRYTALDFNVTGPNGGPWYVTTPVGALEADSTLLGGGSSPVVDIQYV